MDENAKQTTDSSRPNARDAYKCNLHEKIKIKFKQRNLVHMLRPKMHFVYQALAAFVQIYYKSSNNK